MFLLRRILTPLSRPVRWFHRTRRRNKIITIIIIGILVIFIGGLIQSATAKPPYVTQKVTKGDITQVVSETGNINTSGRVDVYSSATGIIEEMYVTNNTFVEINENLFKVRSNATDQEKASANASYQSALSALKTAEQGRLTADAAMWTGQQTLLDARNAQKYKNENTKNPATTKDYTQLEKESIDAAVVQAEKNFRALEKKNLETNDAITAAKAQVDATALAYQATNNAIIKSPTSGTVANQSLSIGDKVTAGSGMSASSADTTSLAASAGLSTGGGIPVLTIANLSNDYSIKIALNEIDIPKVKENQNASITLDAFSDKTFRGVVTHVDSVGTNNQGVITYNVLVALSNPDTTIKPGMTANIDIEVDKVTDVLTVQNNAVKPYKGGRAVRIVDPKTKQLKYIPVEIGLKGENKTQIIKGVSLGQEVITALSNDQIPKQGLF